MGRDIPYSEGANATSSGDLTRSIEPRTQFVLTTSFFLLPKLETMDLGSRVFIALLEFNRCSLHAGARVVIDEGQ